ncbi:hypothetical protein ILUMI_00824 [Ignelater luminosus]|uniref:Arrestin C-terminal-like domain-containing protein n=1 Tax=Ignelater luminosus TaxID=2038154 RepID=A0A8K0DJG4_IGNLU|nr:hypothetical protein ILUMI_00824 [Ignelater luminosus]
METNLLLCETTFPPGVYSYPFTFNLPNLLPSSMDEMYGSIRYSVKAIIDKPWAIDYECKKIFKVMSYKDLTTIDNITKPAEFSVEKRPFSLLDDSKPIKITVNLPISGYVPSQMISFSAKIKNDSDVDVAEVRFKLAQGFVFHVKENIASIDSLVGQEYAIVNSGVPSKSEKSWDLELRIPHNMFNGNLNFSNFIDTVWELRGEVCLPFPYKNFKITVPFYLGDVPLPGTSIF